MKKRFLALFIVFVMLFTQVSTFATEIEQTPALEETVLTNDVDDLESGYSDSELSELVVLEEITDLREENIKHFMMSNGTVKAVAYGQSVHYMDDNGNWIDIDNSLTLNGSEYSTNNKFEIKFANKSGSSGLLSIKDGDYKIDFTPINTNKVSVEIENPQENNSRKFEDVSKLNNLVSKAIYVNIYDGIDIEYILVGSNIKENIIVKEKQDTYTFSFELKLNKLNATLVDGAVILSDYDSGEQIYEIPAPYMLDASNEYSGDVEYTLTQNSKWKYTLTVTASAEWINAEGRAFPVTVDPTINATNGVIDEFITSSNTDESESDRLIVGNFIGGIDVATFIKFSIKEDIIPDTASLLSANVVLFAQVVLGGANRPVFGLYEATNDWTKSLTFENSRSFYNEEEPVDYITVETGGVLQWNISSLFEKWNDGGANHGVCIRAIDLPSTVYSSIHVVSSEGSNSIPRIEVTYIDMLGIEEYNGNISTSVGTDGTSYVNLYNGALTYVQRLTTVGTYGYDISMVYNSINNSWSPSFCEQISPCMEDGTYRYLWKDPDGTSHCFIPYTVKNEWGEYIYYEETAAGELIYVDEPVMFYPEDDIDYVLTKTANGEFILQDYAGNQKLFNSDGQLSKICDAQGNVLYFYYICDDDTFTTEDRLAELFLIVYKSANDEATQQIKLWHDNGRLCYIHNIQTNQEIIIEWDNEQIVAISYSDENQIIDSSVDFIYNDDDSLSNIVNAIDLNTLVVQNSIDYSYIDEKIYEICQYSGTQLESKLTIAYDSTIYVRNFGNLMNESTDDILTSYSFDIKGRKIREIKEDYTLGTVIEDLSFSYNDSLLPSSDYYLVVFNKNINYEPFSTDIDAALMFFNEIYAASFYIKHEFGTRIYSRTHDSITTYNFSHVATGDTHSIGFVKAKIPRNTTIVAVAHTHPNNDILSTSDINYALNHNIDCYMVGPNLFLNYFDISLRKSIYDVMLITTSITLNEGNILVEKFRERWFKHIENGCDYNLDCSQDTLWPNTQMIE